MIAFVLLFGLLMNQGHGLVTRKSIEGVDDGETVLNSGENDELAQSLREIFSYVDENSDVFIRNFREAIAIQSISADPEKRGEVIKMMNYAKNRLESLGALAELYDIGNETKSDGSQLKLPPALLGSLGWDPNKRTVLVYGHLDVQPASKGDGWDTEPFELTEVDGKLYGRGTADDKGPVLGWFHMIEAYQATGIQLPVNLKFCFEGMEEVGSRGLADFLVTKEDFFSEVDFVVISDTHWLSNDKPSLTYGLRGLCYFCVEVECAAKDLHSGVFGGSIYEAMNDLFYLMNDLVDLNGTIKIPGIMDDVRPLTSGEEELYKNIDFDVEGFRKAVGIDELINMNDTVKLLMNRWRYPSLSLHGIQGAFHGDGSKTVIPGKVIGKFSIRLVPDQTPEKITDIVVRFLEDKWDKRGSPNKFKAYLHHGGQPWLADPNSPNHIAGRKAVRRVFGVEPDLDRVGGSIPIVVTFEKLTGKSILLLPMGAADGGAHGQNEKLNIRNYIEGTKLFAAYLEEIARIELPESPEPKEL